MSEEGGLLNRLRKRIEIPKTPPVDWSAWAKRIKESAANETFPQSDDLNLFIKTRNNEAKSTTSNGEIALLGLNSITGAGPLPYPFTPMSEEEASALAKKDLNKLLPFMEKRADEIEAEKQREEAAKKK